VPRRRPEALARGVLEEAAAALQQRPDAQLGDPRRRAPERDRLQARAARVVAALQRERQLQPDQLGQVAQVVARGARQPHLGGARQHVARRRVRLERAQVREVQVVGVAEVVVAHRRKAAARQAAAVPLRHRDGRGAGRPRGPIRAHGALPAAVVRVAEAVLEDRARAAARRAARGELERLQRPRLRAHPALDVGLAVLAPLLGVRAAQEVVALYVMRAARRAAADCAHGAEQHPVGRRGHVNVDPELGPDRGQ